MTTQIGLFGDEVKAEVEQPTPVRLGSRVVQFPLRRRRREALKQLMEVLERLEGTDIHIGSYHAGGRHFWLDNLKLPRLKLEYHPFRVSSDDSYIPTAITLWGSRGGLCQDTHRLPGSCP